MKALEVVCEGCEAHLRLSSSLLERIAGKRGRVSCKQCGNKVGLDARGRGLAVLSGGHLFDPPELERLELVEQELNVHSVRFSEMPPLPEATSRPQTSTPPPLPEELRARRSRAAEARKSALAKPAEMAASAGFEAPPPPVVRDSEDSLSPHSFDDDDEGLVKLGGEIKSAPFHESVRDQTYDSLFPRSGAGRSAAPQSAAAGPEISRAPAPPRAGELRRASSGADNPLADSVPGQVEGPVVVGLDGTPLNTAERSLRGGAAERSGSSVTPWLVALVACFALGLSVASHPQASSWLRSQLNRTGVTSAPPADLSALSERTTGPQGVVSAGLGKPWTDLELWTGSRAESSSKAEPAAAGPSESGPSQPGSGQRAASGRAASASGHDSEASSPRAQGASETSMDESTSATLDAASPASVAEALPSQPAEPEVVVPFSSSAASVELRQATMKASGCRRPDDPSGQARVSVTFAPSGRVTTSTVSGPPFAGTSTGGCIASVFRSARVPSFTGDAVTVTRTVTIR